MDRTNTLPPQHNLPLAYREKNGIAQNAAREDVVLHKCLLYAHSAGMFYRGSYGDAQGHPAGEGGDNQYLPGYIVMIEEFLSLGVPAYWEWWEPSAPTGMVLRFNPDGGT